MKKLILIAVLFFSAFVTFSNNLRISDGTQVSANQISFTLSWDNSWMVGGAPSNHDAVWVFIKYRECGGTGPYIHALLSTTMSDHNFGTTFAAATPVRLADRFGVVPGGATATNGLGNNTGVMIRRSDFAKGNISGTCTLKIVSASGDPFLTGVNYEIKVIGIEMVYVRTEAYSLGDNVASYNSSFTFRNIMTEDAIPANTLLAAHSEIPANFPKGYNGFYCMKYEISEGQYYKFMTTGGNIMGGPADYYGSNRNYLSQDGSTTPDRAQNYMSWGALLAYLDWAALRPMTELEYEKACKGSSPMANYGYAWGSPDYIRAYYLTGTEDGTEAVANAKANCHFYEYFYPSSGTQTGGVAGFAAEGNWYWSTSALPPDFKYGWGPGCNYSCSPFVMPTLAQCSNPIPINKGGTVSTCAVMGYAPVLMLGQSTSQGWGPLRVGIFAGDATVSKTTTGASAYSIMELSGNVIEQTVDIRSTSFTGQWGNGYLGVSGSDVTGWPLATDSRCLRGGGYSLPAVNMRVCDRQYNNVTHAANWGPTADAWRLGAIGGRGVR